MSRAFWLALSLVAGALAFMKAARIPNRWSATQALLDYEHGFLRRALFGATMRAIGVPIHRYQVFVVVAWLCLFLCLSTLVLLALRARLFDSPRGQALTTVFFGSYAITYLSHLVGYMDLILIALAAGSVSVRRPRVQVAAALLAGGVGILIHELYAVAFLPWTLLPALIHAARTRRWLWFWAALTVFASIMGLLACVLARPVEPSAMQALVADLSSRADFPLRHEVFPVLLRGYAENRKISVELWHQPWWFGEFVLGFVLTLPLLCMFVAASLVRLREFALGRALTLWLSAAVVGACLAPMLLHVMGWDAVRWDVLALVVSFGVLTVVHRMGPRTSAASQGPVFQRLALVLLVLHAASGEGFLDGMPSPTFPYRAKVRDLAALIQGAKIEAPQF